MRKRKFAQYLQSEMRVMRVLLLFIVFLFFSSCLFSQEKDDSIVYSKDVDWNLILAAYHNDSTKILHWLEKGADIDYATGDGITPLMYAVQNNSFFSTRLLVANGADINIVPFLGYPALTTACMNNNFDIAEYLIQKGGDVDIVDQYGTTPLLLMVDYGNFYMADMLLYYRANPDYKGKTSTTPLIAAIGYGDLAMTKLLINKNADVNATDKDGNTPLIKACQVQDTAIIRLLFESNINIHTQNNDGFDALAFAIQNKDEETIQLLIQQEADLNLVYSENFNPATISMIYGNPAITRLIKENGGEVNRMPLFKNYAFEIEMPFNTGDFHLGSGFSFIDKKYNMVVETGFRFRPARIRIFNKVDDYRYFQYWERRYLVYSGLKQYRKLYTKNEHSVRVDYGVHVGFTWGNYRGSNTKIESKFLVIPNTSLFYKTSFLETGVGYEYLDFDILKKSPHTVNVFVRFLIRNKFEKQF